MNPTIEVILGRTVLVFIILFASNIHVSAQDDNMLVLGNSSEFGCNLVNGSFLLNSELTLGTKGLQRTIQPFHEISFDWTYFRNEKWGVGAVTGFGVQALNASNQHLEHLGLNYYASYQLYGKLGMRASYKYSLSSKLNLLSSLCIGRIYYEESNFGIGGGTNVGIRREYHFRSKTSSKPLTYFRPAFSLQFVGQKQNIQELSLFYHYQNGFGYEGQFVFREPGEIHRSDIHLGQSSFGINYRLVLTNREKKIRLIELAANNSNKLDELSRRFKAEKRSIYSRDWHFSVSSGPFIQVRKVPEENPIFESATNLSWSISAKAFYFIRRDLALDFSFAVREHWDFHQLKGLKTGGFASTGFYANEFGFGLQKRLDLQNSFNLLNLHCGIKLNITDTRPRFTGGSGLGGGLSRNDTTPPSLIIRDYQLLQFYPVLYAGLSKDFFLSDNIILSPRIQYIQGIFNVTENKYESNGTVYPLGKGSMFYRGSGYSIDLVIQYRWRRSKK